MSRSRPRIARPDIAWLAVYIAMMAMPILLLIPAPSYGDGWSTLAVALGFIAYIGMTMQCISASRAGTVSSGLGTQTVIAFHRIAGIAIVVAVGLHIVVIFITQAWARKWFWPLTGPLEAQAGILALFCLIALAATSIRRPAKLLYDKWRKLHLGLTITAVCAAYVHALQSSSYSSFMPVRATVIAAFVLGLVALIYLRLARTYASLKKPYIVERVDEKGQGVTSIGLVAVDHSGLRFAPGQFAWIKLGEKSVSVAEHPFSFASSALRPRELSFGIKALGDFTSTVQSIAPGTLVLVDGPHGDPRFPLPDAGFICIVGGIGITPALSIIATAADQQDPRPIQLIYGIESSTEIPFPEDLQTLSARCNLSISILVNHPEPDWHGLRGLITTDSLRVLLPDDAASRNIVVCGPPAMMLSVASSLEELGVPPGVVRLESFALA